jgi:hypothetical protein
MKLNLINLLRLLLPVRRRTAWLPCLAGASLLLNLLTALPSLATHYSVLVVNVSGDTYNEGGTNIHQALVTSGITSRLLTLATNGQVETALAEDTFDQIWVFDLSTGDDDYPLDWAAMSGWFQANPSRGIICDARILSSFWGGFEVQGRLLAENYFANLQTAGGGLVLGTDHDSFAGGINSINAQLGLQPFTGSFVLDEIPVDTAHPLMTTPNTLGPTLPDHSTPGQVPFGLQPNGRVLHAVAWHSGNLLTPGISTTIERTDGYAIQITTPSSGADFAPGTAVTFTAVDTNGTAPFTYAWSSSVDGPLGAGLTLTVTNLSAGAHAITVVAVDGAGQIALDSISLTIGVTPVPVLNIATAVELHWESVLGAQYQVQYSTVLDPTNWLDTGSVITGDGTEKSFFDSTRYSEQRFYRLTVVP